MGEKRFSKLCNIWNIIGPFNMNLFSNRLMLQKKIFLLQEIGFNLGYTFTKYLRGPYCSTLANDGYKIETIKNDDGLDCSIENIDKLKRLEKGHEGDALWFELLGTIVYMNKKEGESKENIKKRLSEEKSYLFNEKIFEEAYSRLIAEGLISN